MTLRRLIPLLLISSVVPAAALAQDAAEPSNEAELTESVEFLNLAEDELYEPVLTFDLEGRTLQANFSMADRIEVVSAFPIDRYGSQYALEPSFNTQLRLGAMYNSEMEMAPFRLVLIYEHDVLTGYHSGGVSTDVDEWNQDLLGPTDIVGERMPASEGTQTQLRRAFAQLDYTRDVHFFAGWNMSHWGMGLVANDGDHGWVPGSADFDDPRGGDRVLRGVVALGPFTDLEILVAVGIDDVIDDDALLEGDEAQQGVVSVMMGYEEPSRLGFYGVVRRQTTLDGGFIDVQAADIAGAYELQLGPNQLRFEGEMALIWGETSLSPTNDFPVHDVLQLGAAARASYDTGSFGAVFDFLYASGDSNYDDNSQNGFKADSNYAMGMFLFDYVLAAHYSRASATASDLDLLGVPANHLDRLPTNGSATNTISIFPRAWYRLFDSLELYGGPLFAWTNVPLSDPLNARFNGGAPRNALNGDPGSYLGTELDFGLRYRGYLAGTELTIGAEGGVLLPGSAFATAEGDTMGSVSGARVMARYRF